MDSVLIHSTRYRSSGRVSSLAHHHCRRRTRHSASMDHVGYVEREGERDGILRCGVVCQPSVRNRISDLLVCMDRSTRTLSEFRLSYSPPFFSRFTLLCPEHLTSFEGLTLRFVRYVWYPLYYVTGHGETGYICISRPSLLGHCVRYHCSFVLATSVRIVVCHRDLLIPPVIWSVFDRECFLLPNGRK